MAEGEWTGAQWIEGYGGPWDGTMTQMEFPVEFLGRINVWHRGTTPQGMADGSARAHGTYEPVAWANEELRIVRVEWRAAETG